MRFSPARRPSPSPSGWAAFWCFRSISARPSPCRRAHARRPGRKPIARHRVTHLFTSPTAYKALSARKSAFDLSSLKVCVSAGEALPRTISDLWFAATGIRLIDGIGGTEMIHIFISGNRRRHPARRNGKAGARLSRAIVRSRDASPSKAPAQAGLACAVPPVAAISRSAPDATYVIDGWNMTGDIYRRDEDGYYWFVARADDMIVSGGYNIAGPEVESALALHPDVEECAVVGWPDPERGQIVKAVVVPSAGVAAGCRNWRKRCRSMSNASWRLTNIPAPSNFAPRLPKTATGKLQRSALRAGIAFYWPFASSCRPPAAPAGEDPPVPGVRGGRAPTARDIPAHIAARWCRSIPYQAAARKVRDGSTRCPRPIATRSARPAARMVLIWSAEVIAPTAMVAMPASLRILSENGCLEHAAEHGLGVMHGLAGRRHRSDRSPPGRIAARPPPIPRPSGRPPSSRWRRCAPTWAWRQGHTSRMARNTSSG